MGLFSIQFNKQETVSKEAPKRVLKTKRGIHSSDESFCTKMSIQFPHLVKLH